MGRSDTQLVVRQASLHVWKIVVSNTPRTLREILPTLFGLLLGFLASTCADKRTVSLLDLASDPASEARVPRAPYLREHLFLSHLTVTLKDKTASYFAFKMDLFRQ